MKNETEIVYFVISKDQYLFCEASSKFWCASALCTQSYNMMTGLTCFSGSTPCLWRSLMKRVATTQKRIPPR